jgi:hypothetical protein
MSFYSSLDGLPVRSSDALVGLLFSGQRGPVFRLRVTAHDGQAD